jgi:hypothetical protein
MTDDERKAQDADDEQTENAWLCWCGNYEQSGFHCSSCGTEPPWGCPCSGCQDGDEEADYDEWDYDQGEDCS